MQKAKLFFVMALTGASMSFAQVSLSDALRHPEVFAGFSWAAHDYASQQEHALGGGMAGWELQVAAPEGRLGLEADVSGFYRGNARVHFLTAGPVYRKTMRQSAIFLEGMAGVAHMNGPTGLTNGQPGVTLPGLASNSTLVVIAGGGMDFRIRHRLRWRVKADYVHTNFSSVDRLIHGIVVSNLRISTGPVWRF